MALQSISRQQSLDQAGQSFSTPPVASTRTRRQYCSHAQLPHCHRRFKAASVVLNLSVSSEDSSTAVVEQNSRRTFVRKFASVTAASWTTKSYYGSTSNANVANAAVGSLPEYTSSNAVVQGITIRVTEQSQRDVMVAFLENGFNCEVQRQRTTGTVEDVWLAYGPEEFNIPVDFEIPVSSFRKYGGHASIHIVYDNKSDNKDDNNDDNQQPPIPLYNIGTPSPPGNNIAYVQLGVPGYRISQMVAAGGQITDAYGIVDVVSPSGLPLRGIVGFVPDPIMFVAILCNDVAKSQAFYEQIGFTQQEYPYARLNKGQGQFEPPQPKKSVYMAPSPNCMGVLLLQATRRQKPITVNPVVQCIDVVYTPKTTTTTTFSSNTTITVLDPSGVAIRFRSYADFEQEEKETRRTNQ